MTDALFLKEDALSVSAMPFTPTPTQLVAARAVLGLSMDKLAKEMRAGSQTVVRVETAEGLARVNRSTIAAFLRFFEDHGIQFVETDDRVGLTWPRTAEPER